jgi:16S rRNA (uracil1498-N3)-methyltransferase
LRLAPGDQIDVFDGEGREFQCVIEESRRDWATARIIEEVSPARPESPLDLTLAIALLKGEKFDLVVQKVTELGIPRIRPVITRRADVRLTDEKEAKRVTRWQRIALEAAKQSGRARVPEIAGPVDFNKFMKEYPAALDLSGNNVARLMFTEREGQSLSNALESFGSAPTRIISLVGPEGGWTDEELAMAHEAGWRLVTLGGRILRAETAAIAVTALLENQFGDLR